MITLSHSDIEVFLQCRRKFLFSYVNNYNAPDKLTGALALGTRVHEALAYYYREGFDPADVHSSLVIRDEQVLFDRDAPTFEHENLYSDAIVGRNCCISYREWLATTGADQGLAVESVEQEMEVPFLDGQVLLRGKGDLIFRREDTGALIVNDFKTTGQSLDRTRDRLERSYQLPVYDLCQRILHPDEWVESGMYTVIKKVSSRQRGSVQVDRYKVPGLVRGREMFEEHLAGICRDIIALIATFGNESTEANFYPHPQDACSWCDFKHPCLVYGDNPDAGREMLEVEFTAGRHARYGDG